MQGEQGKERERRRRKGEKERERERENGCCGPSHLNDEKTDLSGNPSENGGFSRDTRTRWPNCWETTAKSQKAKIT